MTNVEEEYLEDRHIIKIKSKKTGLILCARVIMEDEEYYYVYNMPSDEERIPPKKIRQITLETKEEVQAFFDALNKIQKENKK